MISKIVEQQLKKCYFANLNNFDENTNTYFIPKYSKPKYDLTNCYLIKVNKEVINNTNNLLATNWNSGRAPTQEYYKAYISKTMGSYIYCDCLAFNWETKTDLSEMYSGWFNVDDITQIAKL